MRQAMPAIAALLIGHRPAGRGLPAIAHANIGKNETPLGRRVVVEGAISHDGTLSKLVFISPSLRSVGGALGVDRESLRNLRKIVAALSSANPLPPLSGDFKGEQIIVQFTFTPKRR
jgi:hypothetical protein